MINVIGLGLGVSCCFAQYAILKHELSFDNFHQNTDRIYRIVEHYAGDYGMEYSAFLPNPMGHTLNDELTSVAAIPIQGPLDAKIKVRTGNNQQIFSEQNNIIFSNSNFLRYFNFPLIDGTHTNELNEINQVYISEKIAKKYFNTPYATGRTLHYGNDINLKVAGVLKDIPYNTNIHFDLLVSYPTIRKIYPEWTANWGATWQGTTYLVLNDSSSPELVERQISEVTKKHLSAEDFETTKYYLQPIKEVHTDDQYVSAPNYVPPTVALIGSALTVLMILIVSILNFINLATSQSIRRSKEVGIRKTLGGRKSNLITQFMIETGSLVLIAGILGLTIGQVLLDLLNQAVSPFPFRVTYDSSIFFFFVILLVVVTILAGIYPSLVLSRLSPSQAIRNQTLLQKSGHFSLRKLLTVIQFAVANMLIIVTIIATSQMNYIHSKDLGFNQSNVLLLHFSDQATKDLSYIKTDLASLDFVENATWCMGPPQTGYSWNSAYNLVGQPGSDALYTSLKFIDGDYLDTYQIPLIAGRNIESKLLPDSSQQILVNEEYVRRLELTAAEAVGRRVNYNGQYTGTIVGVVKDYHLEKLSRAIRPTTFAFQPYNMNDINLKLKTNDMTGILPVLEDKFRTYDPEGVFEPKLLSEQIEQSYLFENALYSTFQVFAFLAIVIGLMGLYGLVNYMVMKNRKPISIHKVFGASTRQIFVKISREYLALIVIAFIISAPIAAYIMSNWLSNFSYHIAINGWHFAISMVIVIAISMLTVGSKSYQAANSNPADILRHE